MVREKQYSFDSKCWDLAEVFLSDERIKPEEREKVTNDLAQEIQQVIEDFIAVERVAHRWLMDGEEAAAGDREVAPPDDPEKD
jgi:hypothetical protein